MANGAPGDRPFGRRSSAFTPDQTPGNRVEIYLYDEGTCASLRTDEVAADLHTITGLRVEVRPDFIPYSVSRRREGARGPRGVEQRLVQEYPDSVAAILASARVSDPLRRLQRERSPSGVELAAERRALEVPGRTSAGILYDGSVLQWVLWELLLPDEEGACHIVITARLFGTWVPDDRRWHAHAGLYGQPSIISSSGLVQAPARPREYYHGQQLATSRMAPREVVEAELQLRLRDRMLLPDDPRLTQVLTGYALQSVAFHLTGSPFCSVPTCPLYNARRQEELIRAHCSEASALCPHHEALFGDVKEAALG
jgi:hypothetical protein